MIIFNFSYSLFQMSSAWGSSNIRKKQGKVFANGGVRKPIAGTVLDKAKAGSEKRPSKLSGGAGRQAGRAEKECERMKTRGVEWRRFYEDEEGPLGAKMRLTLPGSLESEATQALTSDVLSQEGLEPVIHAASAVNMSVGIFLIKRL